MFCSKVSPTFMQHTHNPIKINFQSDIHTAKIQNLNMNRILNLNYLFCVVQSEDVIIKDVETLCEKPNLPHLQTFQSLTERERESEERASFRSSTD